jgi:hypothetical protein
VESFGAAAAAAAAAVASGHLGDPEITIAPTPVSPGWLARNTVWLDESRQSLVLLKMSLYESL